MAKDDLPEPKRRNKTLSVADALAGALDPVLKKRGFAGRDIITHWRSIAPPPFDATTQPDKLSWPRAERSAEGATLYLRCAPGQALFAQHEAPAIAAAVNRYFGYLLVNDVRLSAEPFTPGSGQRMQKPRQPSQSEIAKVGKATEMVEDDDLREALQALGLALSGRSKPKAE
ncbi:DciA family protein [Devosia sp. XJ19-1]|uniref:DciA family protein n=1 Tax=Devosia ureilytica TaxID=2952754 RepID=A0A9Q4AQG8_9HYPH|nr:DciA family protein [Devosia ureilytica]MCP8884975.1 DciA family protein [Devosia ureilytica]MCP8888514.1 DciA family protein [Devosia ureilytica]